MAPLVRTGGSRHTGLAAPPHRNIHDVELKECMPPDILYHGTGVKYCSSINKQGLISKSRLYVHLSKDIETATNVGSRHGEPFIYKVRAKDMYNDGYKFFLSQNDVWLTKEVPICYLEGE